MRSHCIEGVNRLRLCIVHLEQPSTTTPGTFAKFLDWHGVSIRLVKLCRCAVCADFVGTCSDVGLIFFRHSTRVQLNDTTCSQSEETFFDLAKGWYGGA